MWKIAVGFAVFAGLALFILSKGGDIDMSGEKHGMDAHPPAATASAATPAASDASAASEAASAASVAAPAVSTAVSAAK